MRVVAAIAVVAVLATATLTFAANLGAPAPAQTGADEVEQRELVVPDVRRQAYVFAKGTLEQGGFAWKVTGAVQGYAANVVATQTPAPGTRVLADGAPTVLLQLFRNAAYKQEGLPENASPYRGKPVRLVAQKKAKVLAAAPAPAAAKPKPAGKPKPAPAAKRTPAAKPKSLQPRKPAFVVAGAPKEPLDEIALDTRARQLAAWLERNPEPTPRRVDYWLYQHSWIVTGARFGWSGGAKALRVLIEVDQRAQKLWGMGGRSEQAARRALAEVEARAA